MAKDLMSDEWPVPELEFHDPSNVQAVATSLRDHDVAFVELHSTYHEAQLHALADGLGCKTPFISSFNKNHHSGTYSGNLNYIGDPTRNTKHTVFSSTNEQGLHSDGTYEPAGAVQTTFLFCVTAAKSGGANTLLHTTRIFKRLQVEEPELAQALMHKDALRRYNFGCMNGIEQEFTGPAFEVVNGDVISRFTLDVTADWEAGYKKIPHLKEAVQVFRDVVKTKGSLYQETMLGDNQGIVMRNHKIAHGRTAFENHPGRERIMIRGLYAD